jgi:predicted proteasome-type protease
MSYCVGMPLATGLVLLADSRTNAGVDQPRARLARVRRLRLPCAVIMAPAP